jgi:hypothetical protein
MPFMSKAWFLCLPLLVACEEPPELPEPPRLSSAEEYCSRGPLAECACDIDAEPTACARACEPLFDRWSYRECIERLTPPG